mmetsp:Transcript_115868/g.334615  ORF Transcript_115868/g.334615 Transcript_115868/m.334615 type:complete len:255 (-) Transcript_115868:251-1015(-)
MATPLAHASVSIGSRGRRWSSSATRTRRRTALEPKRRWPTPPTWARTASHGISSATRSALETPAPTRAGAASRGATWTLAGARSRPFPCSLCTCPMRGTVAPRSTTRMRLVGRGTSSRTPSPRSASPHAGASAWTMSPGASASSSPRRAKMGAPCPTRAILVALAALGTGRPTRCARAPSRRSGASSGGAMWTLAIATWTRSQRSRCICRRRHSRRSLCTTRMRLAAARTSSRRSTMRRRAQTRSRRTLASILS